MASTDALWTDGVATVIRVGTLTSSLDCPSRLAVHVVLRDHQSAQSRVMLVFAEDVDILVPLLIIGSEVRPVNLLATPRSWKRQTMVTQMLPIWLRTACEFDETSSDYVFYFTQGSKLTSKDGTSVLYSSRVLERYQPTTRRACVLCDDKFLGGQQQICQACTIHTMQNPSAIAATIMAKFISPILDKSGFDAVINNKLALALVHVIAEGRGSVKL